MKFASTISRRARGLRPMALREAGYVALFALLTFGLSLGASGLAGRALWVDEILRLMGQRLTVWQLLQFEHLRTFCTQTPVGYLVMRPWQWLFGPLVGGCLPSALSAGLVTAAVLFALLRLLRARPHPLAALIVASNPLLVYYGSEIAFYILWAAAGAWAFALQVRQADAEGNAPVPRRLDVWLTLSASLFVALHFAGIFVWAVVALVVVANDVRRAGRRLRLRPLVLVAVPILVNLPMYVGAMRAPEHIGTRTLQLERMATAGSQLWIYIRMLLPMLTGGRWVGIGLLAVGAWRLWRGGRRQRYILALALAMTAAVGAFLVYTHLRDYMPRVARFWVYALAPVLTVVALGLHDMLTPDRRRVIRLTGWGAGLVLLTANLLAVGGLLSAGGRIAPFLEFQAYVARLAPARQVIHPNHYDNRFFGGYYDIPNDGRMVSPSFWEEGRAARIRGLRSIWALVPDAVCVVMDSQRAEEVLEAGVLSLEHGMRFEASRWQQWSWRLGLHPEPVYQQSYAPGIFHAPRETMMRSADETGMPAVVPLPGWRLVPFRSADGTMAFGLLGQAEHGPGLAVYQPAHTAGAHTLELDFAVYRDVVLELHTVDQRLGTLDLKASSAQSHYVPDRQSFPGLPAPQHLLMAGAHFAMQVRPETIRIDLANLPPGWSTVWFSAVKNAPLLLLRHECRLTAR